MLPLEKLFKWHARGITPSFARKCVILCLAHLGRIILE